MTDRTADELRTALRGLPRLNTANRAVDAPACKVCGAMSRFFDSVDFNKVCSEVDQYMYGPANLAIYYYQCPRCDLLFTDNFNDWSSEDFAEFIYNRDYVRVDGDYLEARPARMAEMMTDHLKGCENARILDYGSGSGRFAEHLGSRGFKDITSFDPFSSPERPEGRFDVVLCFEVIEHSNDPGATLADIETLIRDDGCLILSQTLQPPDLHRQLGAWWYLAPRNGHISMFSHITFAWLALGIDMTFLAFEHRDHLYAFGRATSSIYANIALAGTSSFRITYLRAPTDDADGWNGVENTPEGRIRWTANPKIVWPIDPVPAPLKTRVVLEYAAEIVPGFAQNATFTWGGEAVPVRVIGNTIIADMVVAEAAPIILTTPEMVRPDDLTGNGDKRWLGLYIPLEPLRAVGIS